jgi:urease accessory protein
LALESGQQGAAFLATCDAAWINKAPADGTPIGSGTVVPSSWMGESRGGGEVALLFPEEEDAAPRSPPPNPPPSRGRALRAQPPVCHAAVFGAVAANAGIALHDALVGYLQAFAANLVSAGLRLGIVGQTDGQRILAALEPLVFAAVEAAMSRGPDDFGSATFMADLMSMAHETQYSRLFRS